MTPLGVRGIALRLATLALAVVASLCILEIGLRLHHGELFDFSSELREVVPRTERPIARYDARLGWLPNLGRQRGATVLEGHRRSSGPDLDALPVRVLTLGDSFTFGDEVADHETWPAHLSRRTGLGVWNAGVSAYGLDQIYLRAMGLLDEVPADWVILAFIQEDVRRSQSAFYYGWKPFFRLDADTLALDNSPVPRGPPPEPRFARTRRLLGHSLLASALLRRLAPEWWHFGAILEAHDEGDEVAVHLLADLKRRTETRGKCFLAVALPANGRIGTNEGMAPLVGKLAEAGVPVLDLVTDFEARQATDSALTFRPWGHLTPSSNDWVARQVQARITNGSCRV